MPNLIAKPVRWLPGLRDGHPLARGLVGVWPFWEGQGGKVYDVANPFDVGNHGTLTSMDELTDWVASPHGSALDFDGSDDYVDCGAMANQPITDLTILLWLSPGDTSGTAEFAIDKMNDGFSDGWAMQITNSGSIWWYINSTATNIHGAVPWSGVGKYDLLVITKAYTDSYSKCYLNGVEQSLTQNSAQASAALDSASALSLGRRPSGNYASAWKGRIALAVLASRAWPTAEVQEASADPWSLITPRKKTYIMVTAVVTGSPWYYRQQERAVA